MSGKTFMIRYLFALKSKYQVCNIPKWNTRELKARKLTSDTVWNETEPILTELDHFCQPSIEVTRKHVFDK